MKKPIFIAEIKTQSIWQVSTKRDSGYLYKNVNREHIINTALEYGDWISVHTDPRFGGSFDDIYRIRQMTKKPILAKGFHCHNDDVKKALDLGADYVLVVDRFNNIIDENPNFFNCGKILFEISNLDILRRIFYLYQDSILDRLKFVYNGRDLNTGFGKKSIADYHDYRRICKWLCGASLIKTPEDVNLLYPDADAFIVGEHLIEFCNELR